MTVTETLTSCAEHLERGCVSLSCLAPFAFACVLLCMWVSFDDHKSLGHLPVLNVGRTNLLNEYTKYLPEIAMYHKTAFQ